MGLSGLLGGALLLCAAALLVDPMPASAQFHDFEIKEPKFEQGEVDIDYLGDYQFGQPRRRFLEESPGSFLFDDNKLSRQRHTLEIGYGVTKWLRLQLAIEAEQERFDDPATIARASEFRELNLSSPHRRQKFAWLVLTQTNQSLGLRQTGLAAVERAQRLPAAVRLNRNYRVDGLVGGGRQPLKEPARHERKVASKNQRPLCLT